MQKNTINILRWLLQKNNFNMYANNSNIRGMHAKGTKPSLHASSIPLAHDEKISTAGWRSEEWFDSDDCITSHLGVSHVKWDR